MKVSVFIAVVFCSLSLVVGDLNFQKIQLTNVSSMAVCNDGSPATYYFRPGSGDGVNRWNIHFEGGYFCWDSASCIDRNNTQPYLMSSKYLPKILNDTAAGPLQHGGILSQNSTINPNFYNSNQVYLWYCSSDIHSGNITAKPENGNFHFRGKEILWSLIQHLATSQNPPLKTAKQILLSGFSAGAEGVWANVDYVRDLVKTIAPNAMFKAYPDSGWQPDVPEFNLATKPPRRDLMKALYANFNARFNDWCESVYQHNNEQWRCAFPLYSYPFVTTNVFVAGLQYDSPFINDDTNPTGNETNLEYAIVLRNFFLMQTSSFQNFFSPACFCHGVAAFNERWNVITVDGVTAAQVVWQWFISPTSTYTSRHIDSCNYPDCNPTCGCT